MGMKKIIVAIDEHKKEKFIKILCSLDPDICLVKVGSVSFNSLGHQIINEVANKGFEIFLDLKLHDIPNTVKKSIEGLINLPIKMLTVHTSGGIDMLKASVDAVKDTNIKIIGVTALTSLSDKDTNFIYGRNTKDQVNSMLDLIEESDIHGVVCSSNELILLNNRKQLISITPGIRMQKSDDDQKRTMSPKEAVENGADYIVIGRPITNSDDISKTLKDIQQSIS